MGQRQRRLPADLIRAGRIFYSPSGLDDGVGIFRQRRWLWRYPPDCSLETLPISPPADRNGFSRTRSKGGQTVSAGSVPAADYAENNFDVRSPSLIVAGSRLDQ
jgi:hypothetical protein